MIRYWYEGQTVNPKVRQKIPKKAATFECIGHYIEWSMQRTGKMFLCTSVFLSLLKCVLNLIFYPVF